MTRSRRLTVALAPILLVASLLHLATPARATVPGTNGLVAFVSGGPSGTTDIWTMHPDGTGRAPLTSTADIDASPAWSPSGSKIAFVRIAAGQTNPEIWVMNADGSNQHQLTTDPTDVDQEPGWAPDGQHIVFSSNRAEPSEFFSELYVMNPDGSNVMRLTNDPGDDRMADWSPDGSKIAFVSSRSGFNDIWVMDADGTNPIDVTNSQGVNLEPAWWPDGSKIVFTSNPLTPTSTFDLYTIPPGGGSATPLFTTPASEFNPSPSPDGTMVFFDTNGAPPAAPAGAGGTDIVGCDVPVTTCANGGDGLDPSVQAAQDAACPPIALKPLTLLDGVAGQKFGYLGVGTTILATGGTPPYSFGIADPTTYPPGMTFRGAEGGGGAGIVSGRPSAPGTFTFTLEVEDSTPSPTGPCHGSQQYTLVVHCAGPAIREREYGPATVGTEYSAKNRADGGTPPYTWSLSSVGSRRPAGIGINPSDGELVGAPRKEGHSFLLRIAVTDSNGCVGFFDAELDVAPFVDVRVINKQVESEKVLVVLQAALAGHQPGSWGKRGASSPAHDLRIRFAPLGGGFGPFEFLLRNSTDKQVKVRLSRGFVFCFSAELHEAKNEGWGAETCEKVPNR